MLCPPVVICHAETNEPAAVATMVVHNKLKHKRGTLPDGSCSGYYGCDNVAILGNDCVVAKGCDKVVAMGCG